MSKREEAGLIAYEILGREHVEEATNLQIESSFQECLTIGFGIADIPGGTDHDGFASLLGSILDDGLSLGAFDTSSGQLVGVCFNKLHVTERDSAAPLEENVEENMKHPATLDLMRFIFKLESSVDVFEHYGVTTALEVFYIGVDSRYRRYGVGRSLMRSSLELARKLAVERRLPPPEIAYAVFTSNYSQALAEQFGFEWLHSLRYDQQRCYDGKLMSERIGPLHQTAVLAGRRL
ncbi:uncharacterized protein LOC131665890 isoform X2 [Phymastichus coffea]|uniref:uncharacterized protein LOC131665890 isoform X2 n=1 Tax=Phymastichus coffea TaxID=108790 RepID=UPI00273C82E7|nr:uncharacterized protein LOC131665890 isoform X2 [Phymastichus coffea]